MFKKLIGYLGGERKSKNNKEHNGKNKKSNSRKSKKTKISKEKKLFVKVFFLDGFANLIYKKNKNFFIKSLSGEGFYSRAKKISIKNNFGYEISGKNLVNFSVKKIENKIFLSYRREYNKDWVTVFAESKDGVNFKEVSVSKIIKDNFVIIGEEPNFSQLRAFTGENFIYLANGSGLNKWVIDKEYLLTPRQKFFDHNGLKIVETFSLSEGELLLYDASFSNRERISLQLGGALFDKKNADKIIWRSSHPVWEQSFEPQEINSFNFLGAFLLNKKVFAYFEINGELTMVDFGLPNFSLEIKKEKIVEKHKANPIIVPKTENKWESKAAFNAAAIYAEDRFHLIYRAIGEDDVSTWGYASSEDGVNFDFRLEIPVYVPREKFEGLQNKKYIHCGHPAIYESGGGCSGGCEDPRLTKIDDTLYVTYVAYNGYEVPGVAITSIKYDDFVNQRWNWSKARLISKPGQIQKNWMLFPEKINGKFAIIHSITPKIMIDYFDDINEDRTYIEKSFRKADIDESRWDNIVRGAGAPPIKTKYGWLLFYHAMDKRDPNKYKVGAMILDYKEPETILYRSRFPIIEPDESYENEGMKSGVVYVCGAVVEKGILYIYYGGADMVMCVATAKMNDFLERLTADKKTILKKIKL